MYPYGSFTPYPNRTVYGWSNHSPVNTGLQMVCFSPGQYEFKQAMRSLWEQHVAWTRMAITSLVFGLPDTDPVVARLLQNATDMGNALRPIYGAGVADTFSSLIKAHLVIASELVKAAKAGDAADAAAAEKRWYANADQIVDFLSSLNPYFPKEEFRKMFYEHLALTKAEAVTMLQQDYKGSIQLYDRLERQALSMADLLSTFLYAEAA